MRERAADPVGTEGPRCPAVTPVSQTALSFCPLERQGAAVRMADDVRYPLVNAALKHVMVNGDFTGVARHTRVRIDASRIFGGSYANEPVRIDGRDYARFVAGDNNMSIRDGEYILSIRGLHMEAAGRYRVSAGSGTCTPSRGGAASCTRGTCVSVTTAGRSRR